MTQGRFTAYTPVITLTLLTSTGEPIEVDAVVDTGFDGFLVLPPALMIELRAPRLRTGRAAQADGRPVDFDIYQVIVLWNDAPRQVEANAVGEMPIIGMEFLYGHDLHVEIVEGGRVVIEARV